MLVWIQVVLLLSLFTNCLVLGMAVVSEFGAIREMSVSADAIMKYTAKSRIICAAQCRQHSDCAMASFDKATEECVLHQHVQVTHKVDADRDILWMKGLCEENWRQFTGSCYHFSEDKTTWKEAQDNCKKKDAKLVKINDAMENNVIRSIQKGQYNETIFWIGANDIDIEDVFVWSADNTRLSYRDWHPGEPNNANDEDCVVEFNGGWFDEACNDIESYICEK